MHLYQWEHGEVHGTCWPDYVLTTTKAYVVCMLARLISEPSMPFVVEVTWSGSEATIVYSLLVLLCRQAGRKVCFILQL